MCWTFCAHRPCDHADRSLQPLHQQQLGGSSHPGPFLCSHPVGICLLPLQAQVSSRIDPPQKSSSGGGSILQYKIVSLSRPGTARLQETFRWPCTEVTFEKLEAPVESLRNRLLEQQIQCHLKGKHFFWSPFDLLGGGSWNNIHSVI